jgi:hypothetical protein
MKDSKYLNALMTLMTGILAIAFVSSQDSIHIQIGKYQFLRI